MSSNTSKAENLWASAFNWSAGSIGILPRDSKTSLSLENKIFKSLVIDRPPTSSVLFDLRLEVFLEINNEALVLAHTENPLYRTRYISITRCYLFVPFVLQTKHYSFSYVNTFVLRNI